MGCHAKRMRQLGSSRGQFHLKPPSINQWLAGGNGGNWRLTLDCSVVNFQEGSRNSSWSRRVVTAGFGFVLSNWGILQEPQRHHDLSSLSLFKWPYISSILQFLIPPHGWYLHCCYVPKSKADTSTRHHFPRLTLHLKWSQIGCLGSPLVSRGAQAFYQQHLLGKLCTINHLHYFLLQQLKAMAAVSIQHKLAKIWRAPSQQASEKTGWWFQPLWKIWVSWDDKTFPTEWKVIFFLWFLAPPTRSPWVLSNQYLWKFRDFMFWLNP